MFLTQGRWFALLFQRIANKMESPAPAASSGAKGSTEAFDRLQCELLVLLAGVNLRDGREAVP
jgi:hypothetical protein